MSKPPTKKAAPAKAKAKAKAAVAVGAPIATPDDMKWKARHALQTLKEAHEIKNDPKLMDHVRAHAQNERAAISKVIGRGGKKA